jgi:hypothetical protein
MLDSTLFTVENLSKQLTELKTENNRLSKLVERADRYVFVLCWLTLYSLHRSSKDSLFMEGAAWLGRKVVDIADKMGDKVCACLYGIIYLRELNGFVRLHNSWQSSRPSQEIRHIVDQLLCPNPQ